MNIASIDVGSNTVLLLVASISDAKLKPLVNKYESPRLGKGLQIGGEIREEGIKHLLKILKDYKNIINKHECTHVILTATNAMRIASNSQSIISRIKDQLAFNVKIIQGDEEARLSYLGASSSFNNLEEKTVIDIGGGSTEIIFGNNKELFFKKSFQTGVVSLTEKYIRSFPYSEESVKSAEHELKNIFSELNSNIPSDVSTIAVAGTPTTLSCIKQNIKIYDEQKVEASTLESSELIELTKVLQNLSGNDIKQKYGQVVAGREDVLFAGALILNYLKKILKIDKILVSSRGLRYGNIIDYINTIKVR